MKNLFKLLAVSLCCSSAWAAVFDASINAFPTQIKTDGTSVGTASWDNIFTTVKAGGLMGPLYIGVGGEFEDKNYKRQGYGLVVGAHHMGFVADLLVLPVISANISFGGSSAKFSEGLGIGVDLGYQAPLEPVYVGFTLSYRNYSFNKVESSGITLSQKNQISELSPRITVGVRF